MRSKRSAAVGSDAVSSAAAIVALAFGGPLHAEDLRIGSSLLAVAESVEVASPASGVLLSVHVVEGAAVGAGDGLAEIDSREQRLHAAVVEQDLALARREAANDVRVRLAEKQHRVAEAELLRATSVNAELPNTVSAKEVDRLRLALESAELEIEHARFQRDLQAARIDRIEADLALERHRVERLRIESPTAGVVAELLRRPGEWVEEGASVLRLVRVDRLRVEGFVGVEQAATGLVGLPVTVETPIGAGPPVRATGRVVFVSPEAEPIGAKVRFAAEIDNASGRLRPGLPASVVIHRDEADPKRLADSAR